MRNVKRKLEQKTLIFLVLVLTAFLTSFLLNFRRKSLIYIWRREIEAGSFAVLLTIIYFGFVTCVSQSVLILRPEAMV
jgi:hypothetical protein